eukprot:TRINITY_DN2062_c0_g1_i4.p1 TRINITY_DN2062_c0_g1~~TRINITY_DN2062_c0_g1_i4.p1  ORF type:complete len:310 (-),score=61.70 TRINITY_DN2062_c0_g1_i4:494-1423(-)
MQLSVLVSVTLVIMLGGLATFQIVSYVRTLEETTKEINKTLRNYIAEQNEETQRLLKTNLNSLTDVVQAMQNDLEFLRKQQLTPLQQLMQDVLTRESEIVRMLEHIPMIIKPLDYETLVPAEQPQQLTLPGAPTFKVSLFPAGVDEVSDALRKPGATPPGDLWSVAAEVLAKNTNKMVVDVGGHIGCFGLLAASLGHKVYAFETSKQMAEKYAQGVVLNSLQSKVTIFPVAVHSSSAGKASIPLSAALPTEGNQVVQLGKIDDYVPQSSDLFILKLSGVFGILIIEYFYLLIIHPCLAVVKNESLIGSH